MAFGLPTIVWWLKAMDTSMGGWIRNFQNYFSQVIGMHARNLVELAARLVLTSNDAVPSRDTTAELAKQYWTASKCRLESWQRAIRIFQDDLQERDPWHNPWPATEAVIQEILLSELLTRIWSAVLIQRDQATSSHELTGLARSVFISHLEVANLAMRLLMAQDESCQASVQRMDRLRRRIERWTDLLLAHIADESVALRFAHDRSRMLDFAQDRREQDAETLQQSRSLLLATLIADLKRSTSRYAANPELNRQIAAGVMAFLPAEQFDSTGLPKSTQHMLVEQTPDETDNYWRKFGWRFDDRDELLEPVERIPGPFRLPYGRG